MLMPPHGHVTILIFT